LHLYFASNGCPIIQATTFCSFIDVGREMMHIDDDVNLAAMTP